MPPSSIARSDIAGERFDVGRRMLGDRAAGGDGGRGAGGGRRRLLVASRAAAGAADCALGAGAVWTSAACRRCALRGAGALAGGRFRRGDCGAGGAGSRRGAAVFAGGVFGGLACGARACAPRFPASSCRGSWAGASAARLDRFGLRAPSRRLFGRYVGHGNAFPSPPGARPGPVLVIIGHYRVATLSRLSVGRMSCMIRGVSGGRRPAENRGGRASRSRRARRLGSAGFAQESDSLLKHDGEDARLRDRRRIRRPISS